MIGGVYGSAWIAKVIVRAIGPSLPVTGKLADPTLELRDRNDEAGFKIIAGTGRQMGLEIVD